MKLWVGINHMIQFKGLLTPRKLIVEQPWLSSQLATQSINLVHRCNATFQSIWSLKIHV